MRSVYKGFAIVSLAALIACGGGGGGSESETNSPVTTATDRNASFQTFPPGFFSNGYSESYQLSGSDSDGFTYSGTYIVSTKAETVFNGQPAVPVEAYISLTDNTGAFISVTETTYYTTDSANRMMLGFVDYATPVTKTGATMNVIPQAAKIDAFGTVGVYSGGSDGLTWTYTWRITDANNGLAHFVAGSSATQYGTSYASGESTFVIDQAGNRKSMTFRAYYFDMGLTLTLSGNKQ